MRYGSVVCAMVLLGFLPPALWAHSKGPRPRRTGGFKEQNCTACHKSYPLNAGRALGGSFSIRGVPDSYRPGQSYPLTIRIAQPGQSRWGFELAVRSARTGQQAGELVPTDRRTQVRRAGGIQYIEHTEAGTRRGRRDGPVEFHLTWVAPAASHGPVIFNAAGNAANASGDPKGDYIYTDGAFSRAAGTPALRPTASLPAPRSERMMTASRLILLPVPKRIHKGQYEIHIEHRFLESVFASRPGDAFGTDQGANINLGLNYGLSERLAVGVSRTRFDQIVVFKGLFRLRDPEDSWLGLSLVGGVEGERNFESHYSPFLQVPVSLDLSRLRLLAVPTLVLNSRQDGLLAFGRDLFVNPGENNTFSLGLGADLMLNRRLSLTGEYVPRLAGFGGFGIDRATLSWGVKVRTLGHVFTILVSNSREFTPAKYAVNARSNDFALGFNIYRLK